MAIAHYRQDDNKAQSVNKHLVNVAHSASRLAQKVGLMSFGQLAGLLHDLGKFSSEFQIYIMSATGQIDPDAEEYVDANGLKGKIDHSTAGAQYVWNVLNERKEPEWLLARQILAICLASHHSGLIDCLSPVGEDILTRRMGKSENRTHQHEVLDVIDAKFRKKIDDCLTADAIANELNQQLELLKKLPPLTQFFNLGMLTRFLFSTLIDADRLDSAIFDDFAVRHIRAQTCYPEWSTLLEKLERHIVEFAQRNEVDRIRTDISLNCRDCATRKKGLYLLTVPTGGGKTLASLRFALHHANKHKMDRIIYVIPYTSIIDQNASVVRSVLEDDSTKGTVVLEHHSNLTPERDTWQSKILSENWDAPVVFTTAVQFLETLFSSGTRGARRMHQLANAVIVFDEIQTLPIRTIHLFNNVINFLIGQCGSTAVFCTATQPLLDRVDKAKGAAKLASNPEMMRNVSGLFKDLRRVEVIDGRKNGGWQEDEIATEAIQNVKACGSVLVIVNTKKAAQGIFKLCQNKFGDRVYHLSTNMCPAHRMEVLGKIKSCLSSEIPTPIICVSTQLIEAGVDIDFGCVIRYLAGLDSIAQAAGRCNRNGLRKSPGKVLIVNPASEKPPADIEIAKAKTERVLDEFRNNPIVFDDDLIGPKTMELYYRYYFFERAQEMSYPVNSKQIGVDGDLLSLLSTNDLSVKAYQRVNKKSPPYLLRQSFKTAAEAFAAIDAPTEGVIVPYGNEGTFIIGELCGAYEVEKQYALLRKAQRYAVNVFPNVLRKLLENGCIQEVQKGSGIMYLDERYYSNTFGLSLQQEEPMQFKGY